MKKKYIWIIILLGFFANSINAQIVRPFTIRYSNPSERGNIVYVSNSIISTTGSTGTGEVPPSGTSTDNGGAGVYLDVDNPAPVTQLNYGSTWNYYATGTAPANDISANTWKQSAYTLTGTWNTGGSGSGAGKYGFNGTQTTCLPSGCTPVCTPAASCIKYTGYYFRNTVSFTAAELSTTYSSIRLNIKRDDGIVVYINGVERARDNMAAGVPVYGTLASTDISTGTAEDYTVDLSTSFFTAGANTIAVEIHTFKTKSTDMSFDMQIQGVPLDNSGTFSSSTSNLNIASCSQVLFAGLYWGTDQGTSGTNTAWMTGAEKNIKLKIPGASSYTTLSSQQTDYHSVTQSVGLNHTGYLCFKDVTSLINTFSPNGVYAVADVLGPVGISNSCGGWTLVIVYSNPTLPPRNLTVFDGSAIVNGGDPAIDIGISGFLTPPSGTVSCELGAVVYDGDRGSLDSFAFKQSGAASFYNMATTTIPLNGTNDAWNSKISYKGSVVTTRNPAYYNTLGYDASVFDLPNTSNAQLGNSQSAATVRFASPSENYFVHVLTTSISQYDPSFTLDKTSSDVNGGSLVGGDILRYVLTYNNVGNDASINSIIYDNIPAGTSYSPGSLKINGVSKTDATGDDQSNYDVTNNRVLFRIGTGANSSSGGLLNSGASGTVQFDVVVASSCSILTCGTTVSNIARIDYTGQSSLQNLYDSSGVTTSGCLVSPGSVINTVASGCYIPADTSLVNTCPATSVTLPNAKYAGYSFYSAMPFTSGNLYNPSASVTATHTYYAYFSSGTGCSDTIRINVYINTCPDIDDDNDGIPDYVEINLPVATQDADGDGIPNWKDTDYPGYTDYNSDGFNDNFDPAADSDNDGTPNFLDTNFPGFIDSNGDGVNDNMDKDLDGIPNNYDRDSDNDGIPDVVESGGVDANGDGVIDNYTDTDNDGLSQNVDASNTGVAGSGNGLGAVDTDSDGIPNYFDLDSDNDGIPDVVEVYGTDTNNDGKVDSYTDTDGDGYSDSLDGDVGNDTVAENSSAALLRTGSDGNSDGRADSYPYKNIDSDSKANPYDLDSDGDGITDVKEAFPSSDTNYDGRVDGSFNSDGWNTNIAALGSLGLPDADGTGRSNVYDIDSDDDGIPDNIEGQTTGGYLLPSGSDTDNDGIDNSYDNYSGFGGNGIPPLDTDGDAVPDYRDTDTDGDGILDLYEGNDYNSNNVIDDGVALIGTDSDGDGLDDFFDLLGNAKGTSAKMGNFGSFTGDASPGSKATVQRNASSGCPGQRDWRCISYILNCNIISFKAVLLGKRVQLDWSALCQQEVDYFIVERSRDGVNFSYLDLVKVMPNANGVVGYHDSDDVSSVKEAVIYYRLKSVASTAKVSYSNTVSVLLTYNSGAGIQIVPNPVKDQLKVTIVSVKKGVAEVQVFDENGKILINASENILPGNNFLGYPQTEGFPNGIYYLRIKLDENIITRKFNKLK
ncbi:MAG: type sorting protein [Chitinophagaceae bacterium]|nr:type sorting protein [Chitinophagaceae bacterium]